MADEIKKYKDAGAAALAAKDYDGAASAYSSAIKLSPEDPDVYKLYSNRSAVHASAGKYDEALEDALETIKVKPDWAKGYSRQGAALSFLGRHADAVEAYEKAVELDPGNAPLKNSLQDAQEAASRPAGRGGGLGGGGLGGGLGGLFDASALSMLKTHPSTRAFFLQDPNFENMIKVLTSNPSMMNTMLQDQRIMQCFSVILENKTGMKMGSEEDAANGTDANMDSPMTFDPMDVSSPPPPQPKEPEPEMDTEVTQSLAEKEKGNAAYKSKDLDKALEHYRAAQALDPANMVFLSNIAAVYFEQEKYAECIEECEKAVEVGRENRASYKLISKAYTRIATVHRKREELGEALKFYNKAISEHRDDAIVKKARELEKMIKEQKTLAYINPEIADQEKAQGTEFFKKGDFPSAIKHYTEAIRRNPKDARLFSNRAACYTKLLEFGMALSDCAQCIKLDPAFVKGYLRKAQALIGMKDTTKAMQSYQKALELDPNCQEAIDGYRTCTVSEDPEQVRKRAMEDPEVQAILKDPAMQSIMEQMQTDPKALREHLKNPDIAAKIQKLAQSGLIQFR